MEFQTQAAIWLQIARQVAARIGAGEWGAGERIPSVRELASDIQVNPNTVARSVSYLQEEGLIINQRGIGYFVAEDGMDKARELRKKSFTDEILPQFFAMVEETGTTWDELKYLHQEYKSKL